MFILEGFPILSTNTLFLSEMLYTDFTSFVLPCQSLDEVNVFTHTYLTRNFFFGTCTPARVSPMFDLQ